MFPLVSSGKKSIKADVGERERGKHREAAWRSTEKRLRAASLSQSVPSSLLLPLLLLLFLICFLHHAALISAGSLARHSGTLNPLPALLFCFQMAQSQSRIYLSSFALSYHSIYVSCKHEKNKYSLLGNYLLNQL